MLVLISKYFPGEKNYHIEPFFSECKYTFNIFVQDMIY